VISYHSDIVRQKALLRVYRPLLWRVLRRADRILATSPRYIDSSPFLSRLRDKCAVVPLGVDTARFAAADPARVTALRNQLTTQPRTAGRKQPPNPAQRGASSHPTPHSGAQAATQLLLSVGKLRYYKGLDTLIQALPQLPSARLVIVGAGPMDAAWRELAAALSVADRVVFVGEVDDAELPIYYHAAAVFALPANARAEAFGTVLVEAMAAGLPCVTTEVGSGTSWVVQDGVTGRVVPPRDPDALAEAITPLLADADLRRRLGQAGAERARAEFDERLMIDRILAAYTALIR
jgi:rhamnosyl/mannosyltransferase